MTLTSNRYCIFDDECGQLERAATFDEAVITARNCASELGCPVKIADEMARRGSCSVYEVDAEGGYTCLEFR